jgi:hypothetical protein
MSSRFPEGPGPGGPFLVAMAISLAVLGMLAEAARRPPPVPPAPIVNPCPGADSAPIPHDRQHGPRTGRSEMTARRSLAASWLAGAGSLPADSVGCGVVAAVDRGEA